MLTITVFLLMTLVSYTLLRNLFHPAFILSLVWLTAFTLIYISPDFYFPDYDIQLVILSYIMVFVLVSIAVSLLLNVKQRPRHIKYACRRTLIIMTYLLMIGLTVYLIRYVEIIMQFNSLKEYFFNIRYAAIHTDQRLLETGAFLTNIKTFSSVFSIIIFYESKFHQGLMQKKILVYTFILMVLLANVIEGARNEFVILTLAYGAVAMYFHGVKAIIPIGFGFILLFFMLSVGMRGVSGETIGSVLFNYLNHLVLYSSSSIYSFGYFYENDLFVPSEFVIKLVNKLNVILGIFDVNAIVDHPPLAQLPFAQVGTDHYTNVYSFIAVHVSYFGFLGSYLTIALFSSLVTFVYAFRQRFYILMPLYFLMIPTLITTTFYEYFFFLIPHYARMILLLFIVYYLKPFKYFP